MGVETTPDSLSKESFTSEFTQVIHAASVLSLLCSAGASTLPPHGRDLWLDGETKEDRQRYQEHSSCSSTEKHRNSHGTGDANEMNLKSKTPRHQQQTTEIFKDGGTIKISVSLKVNYSFNTIPIKISAGNFVN